MFGFSNLEVSVSNTSIIKSSCKYCGSKPKFLYFTLLRNFKIGDLSKIMSSSLKDLQQVKIGLNTKLLDKYLKERNFKISWLFDKDICRLMKFRMSNHINFCREKDFLSVLMECNCGRSVWAYLSSNKPHLKNKQMSYKFPIFKASFD